jgi:YtoQ family protein
MIEWSVYLSGEIHTDWRERIVQGCKQAGVKAIFLSPVTDHATSDDIGEAILGKEDNTFWRDHKSAKINTIRTRSMIESADIVVVRFGDKYRQWNAAFDAGYAAAIGKPIITLHDPALTHALKEVDGAAMAVAESPEQVVEILKYTSAT